MNYFFNRLLSRGQDVFNLYVADALGGPTHPTLARALQLLSSEEIIVFTDALAASPALPCYWVLLAQRLDTPPQVIQQLKAHGIDTGPIEAYQTSPQWNSATFLDTLVKSEEKSTHEFTALLDKLLPRPDLNEVQLKKIHNRISKNKGITNRLLSHPNCTAALAHLMTKRSSDPLGDYPALTSYLSDPEVLKNVSRTLPAGQYAVGKFIDHVFGYLSMSPDPAIVAASLTKVISMIIQAYPEMIAKRQFGMTQNNTYLLQSSVERLIRLKLPIPTPALASLLALPISSEQRMHLVSLKNPTPARATI